MLIPTKYNIGYTYWVPRVYKQFVRTETLRHEGEEWTRDVFEMRAFAKQKVIRCMEIKVHTNGTISTTYGVENITDAGTSMFQWYPEANIPESNTEEIAQAFAEGYMKDNPDKEYFGN
jgi:hypothetical protein